MKPDGRPETAGRHLFPGPLLATAWVCCVSGVARCPLLIAGLAVRLRRLAMSFLPMASISICSPWITGPYNMHAAARLPGYVGRVHEVRRSQPKLSGPLILEFGVSSPPRASPDSYLWPGHTFRVRCSSWLACVVSRTHMWEYGSYQRLHGRRFSFLTTGVAGTSLGHVKLLKSVRRLPGIAACVAAGLGRPWRVPVG